MVTAKIAVCAIKRSNTAGRIELYRSFLPVAGIIGGATIDISRSNLIADLNAGKHVVTVFQRNGKWEWGADVQVTAAGYLRTDQDEITEDNLGILPEF